MNRFEKIAIVFLPLVMPLFAGAASGQKCDSLVGFCNPLSSDTVCGALKLFLNALLNIGAPILVLVLVYAGFKFVWAKGNPVLLENARRNLVYTLMGIGIFMGAWLLGQILANTLTSVAGSTNNNGQIGSCV